MNNRWLAGFLFSGISESARVEKYGTNYLDHYNTPLQRRFYRARNLCLEQKKAHVVLVRKYSQRV